MDIMDAYNLMNQQTALNNQWSAQMAANNMNFQLDMANTSHQREVQDLKAAGLNPILSAHGNGASVGSGAMANPDTNNSAMLASILKDVIASNTAIGVANAKAAGGGYYGYTNKNNDEKDPDAIWNEVDGDTEKKWKNGIDTVGDVLNTLFPNAKGVVNAMVRIGKRYANAMATGAHNLGSAEMQQQMQAQQNNPMVANMHLNGQTFIDRNGIERYSWNGKPVNPKYW